MLSVNLELAIQALNNISKIYAFMNGDPLTPSSPGADDQLSSTPKIPDRYSVVLEPDELLTARREDTRWCYRGLSEGVAGLIEVILELKTTLRNVYSTNEIDASSFTETLDVFRRRAQEV